MSQPTEPDAGSQPTGNDPLIDEIREIRRTLSERFDNDPIRLGEHARRVSEEYRQRGAAAAVEAAALAVAPELR
jgi:hypothetical protein